MEIDEMEGGVETWVDGGRRLGDQGWGVGGGSDGLI